MNSPNVLYVQQLKRKRKKKQRHLAYELKSAKEERANGRKERRLQRRKGGSARRGKRNDPWLLDWRI